MTSYFIYKLVQHVDNITQYVIYYYTIYIYM